MYNYISLFSGGGVGCYGFNQEGFEGVATSELIERRLNIQRHNNKMKYEEGYILGDITDDKIKEQLLEAINNYNEKENNKEIDVILFTPPCQGMSAAYFKKNEGVIYKNSLVVKALEIVKEIRPKFFVSENVRKFMETDCIDHDKNKKIKEAFQDWLSEDYIYEDKIINFKDYGANSHRTRNICIGVRKDLSKKIHPESLFPSKEKEKTLREVIGNLPNLNIMGEISENDIYHNFRKYNPEMRAWIHDINEGESAYNNKDPLKRHHKIVDGKFIPYKYNVINKYNRQIWNHVALTVHTRTDTLSSQNTVHPTDDRVFSIRELMLMMNIPKDFKWTPLDEKELNKLSIEEKEAFLKENEMNIRQCIGESIPPIIMQKIAKNIKEGLNGELKGDFQTKLI